MSNFYGESESYATFKEVATQPINIVSVPSDETVPFRYEVAKSVLSAILSNHEYSAAISSTVKSKNDGKVTRATYQDEVLSVTLTWTDKLIDKLTATTKKESVPTLLTEDKLPTKH